MTRGCGVCEVSFSCQCNKVLEFPDNHLPKARLEVIGSHPDRRIDASLAIDEDREGQPH